jgi:hypothetical protein
MDCVVSLMKDERCQVPPVPLVSPLNELAAPRTSPLHPQLQTSSDRTGMSARLPIGEQDGPHEGGLSSQTISLISFHSDGDGVPPITAVWLMTPTERESEGRSMFVQMTPQLIFAVAAGGALGSVARYWPASEREGSSELTFLGARS